MEGIPPCAPGDLYVLNHRNSQSRISQGTVLICSSADYDNPTSVPNTRRLAAPLLCLRSLCVGRRLSSVLGFLSKQHVTPRPRVFDIVLSLWSGIGVGVVPVSPVEANGTELTNHRTEGDLSSQGNYSSAC